MKLCDIKPMYGHVFEDYLQSYEFWGFGDIDLVYGDLRKLLTKAEVAGADVISCRRAWLSGSLCILRNSPAITRLYRTGRKWREVVGSEGHILWDELGGMYYRQRDEGVPFEKLGASHESFSLLVHRAQTVGVLNVWSEDVAREYLSMTDRLVRTSEGIIDCKTGQEYAFYHMVINKRRWFSVDEGAIPPEEYFITATGMYDTQTYGSMRQRVVAAQRFLRGTCAAAVRWAGRKL